MSPLSRQTATILAHGREPALVVEGEGRVAFVNAAAAALLGGAELAGVGTTLARPLEGSGSESLSLRLVGGALAEVPTRTVPIEWEGEAAVLCFLDQTLALERERRAREAAEAHLARTQRIARVGTWAWDLERQQLTWSDEIYLLFALERDTPLTLEAIVARIHPDDREQNQTFVERLLAGEQRAELEFRLRLPDGTGRDILQFAEVHCDDSGAPVAVFGTMQDITERRRAEAALSEQAERTERLFELSNDAIFVQSVAPDGTTIRFIDVNDVACTLLGWTRAELLSPTPDARAAAALTAALLEIGDELARTGRAVFEVALEDRSGLEIPVEVSTRMLDAGGGRTLLSIARDLRERKRAERALAAERDTLRAFLAAAPAAIFVLDESERVVHANPAAGRLFGREGPDSAVRFGDFVVCQHRLDGSGACGDGRECGVCPLYGAVREALAGRGVADRSLEIDLGSPGVATDHRWLIAQAEPLTLDGRPAAVLAVHDVTELRRAQHEREALQASLAQADRLASMGMIAAGVAHEINNPLAYVLYNLQSLSEDLVAFTGPVQRCLAELERSLGPGAAARVLGEDVTRLNPTAVDDLLERAAEALTGALRIKHIARGLGTFSRVEPGEAKPVAVRMCIEHAVNMAYNEIKYRARLVKDFAPVPEVLASEGALVQVFLNLLVNAAHAIEEGNVDGNEIRIRTASEEDRVIVEVTDTGRGIAVEDQGRVFEPFFTTRGRGGGSGLGLAICRNLLRDIGGQVGFTSEPGRGARFRVELPRLPTDWGRAKAAEQPAPAAPPAERGRVLVVDDEDGLRQALRRLLRADHEVVLAASGMEAKALVERGERFDLVLCDLMMPKVSGMQLHGWLAERHPSLAAQVVFLTGGAFTPGAKEYLSRVANVRVEKPFEPASLRRLVGDLIRAARARDAAK